MNKQEQTVNTVETTAEDERLAAVLTAAYPAGEASTALKQRVAGLAAHRSTPGPSYSLKIPVMLQRRLASAFIIFAALYLALAYTYPGRSTKVFGQVEQAMQEIKTAHWTRTITRTNQDGKVVGQSREKVWVRTDPPAYAATVLAPPRNKGSRYVINANGQVLYDPILKRHIYNPMARNGVKLDLEEVVRKLILADVLAPEVIENNASLEKKTTGVHRPWTNESVSVDGQQLIKFYREFDVAAPQVQRSKVEQTIWADPQSFRIVRSERRTLSTKAGSPVRLEVNEQYQYNEEPPKGTFALTPKGAMTKKTSR